MKFKIIVIIFFLFFVACRGKEKPNISKLLKDSEIVRFDRDVFALDKNQPDLERIKMQYGRFFDIYTMGVLQLGKADASDFPELFSLFLRDSVIHEVYDSVVMCYPDMRSQEKELSTAFAYYRHYFPKHTVPKVYTHISGFNQSVIVDSAVIGISLDNYLGQNCVFYRMLATPVPAYIRRRMTSDYIVKDALFGWLNAEFPYRPLQNDLISGMIYQGKIVYVLEKLLPDREAEYLFDYTRGQLDWCKDNEAQIWGFLIENEYLFSTQQMLLRKYLYEAPFTSGMPAESPGKAVVWNGYRIVEEYMHKTKVDLEVLMTDQDYHKILRIGGYRP